MIWNPVLDGELADSARAILTDLTSELAHEHDFDDASLAFGCTGAALLFDHLARADSVPSFGALASSQLTAAKASLTAADPNLGLFTGVTGVAWMLARCCSDDGSDATYIARVDAALEVALESEPWRGPFGLSDGLVGMGVYWLERREQPRVRACLERLVERLDECATREVSGISWHTSPSWLSPRARARYPREHFDLGLEQGVPGVIALLAKLRRAGIARARCDALLEASVQWLLAHARIGEASFPSHVGPELASEPTRSAWCYGDPGVAVALMAAARCLGNAAWEAEAERIALTACRRPLEHTGVVDASVCHGAAGLALIYQRFFHATGNPAFRTAARAWYARMLEMRTPGDGVAGYLSWSPNEAGLREWRPERALLTGAIGVALCLHAGLSEVSPTWDRVLMLDLDPPSA